MEAADKRAVKEWLTQKLRQEERKSYPDQSIERIQLLHELLQDLEA